MQLLAEAERCARGEFGALLRREKLYRGQLQQWRREFAERGVGGLAKSVPGPKAAKTPEQRRSRRDSTQPRALSDAEHAQVLETLYGDALVWGTTCSAALDGEEVERQRND